MTTKIFKRLTFVSVIIFAFLFYKNYNIDKNQELGTLESFSLLSLKNFEPHNEPKLNDKCPVQDVNITAANSQCLFVEKNCDSNIYLWAYYCLFVPVTYPHTFLGGIVFAAISLFLLFFFFLFIWETVDVNLAPLGVRLAKYMKMPPGIAGTTIFSLVNCSPIIFSIIAGIVTENNTLVLSLPVGSLVCVLGLVLGLVLLFAKNKMKKKQDRTFILFEVIEIVTKRSVYRDIVFCFIALLIVFFMYLLRLSIIYAGIALFGLYLSYVLFIAIGRWIYTQYYIPRKEQNERIRKELERKKRQQQEESQQKGLQTQLETTEENVSAMEKEVNDLYDPEEEEKDWSVNFNIRGINLSEDLKDEQKNKISVIEKSTFEQADQIYENQSETNRALSSLIEEDHFGIGNEDDYNNKEGEGLLPNSDYGNIQMERIESAGFFDEIKKDGKIIRNLWVKFLEEIQWQKKSLLEKIIYIIFGWYTRFLRNLCVSTANKKDWNKYFSSVTPFFGSILFSFTIFRIFSLISGEVWKLVLVGTWFAIAILIGAVCSLVVFFTTVRHRPPIYNPVLVVFSFINSLCFIYLASEANIHITITLSKILGIKPAIFGVTLLSFGNTFTDLIANVRMSYKGLPQLALGSCFGETALSLMIGFFIIFITTSVRNLFRFGEACDFFAGSTSLSIAFIFAFIVIFMTAIILPLSRFKVKKLYGVVLICLYAIFLVCLVLLEFNVSGIGEFLVETLRIPISISKLCPVFY